MDSAEIAWSSSEGTQWGVWQEQGELQTEWKPSVILGADACLANSAQEEDKVLRMRTARVFLQMVASKRAVVGPGYSQRQKPEGLSSSSSFVTSFRSFPQSLSFPLMSKACDDG